MDAYDVLGWVCVSFGAAVACGSAAVLLTVLHLSRHVPRHNSTD
jgi:hypothetical protein